MPREHARVKLSIWEDDEFRALTPAAQHLYLVLMIHPQLDYCGVADWRPSRLAGFAADWSAEDVQLAAKELSEHGYIVIDEATEEVLLRSFIRNDGLMDSPNLATAVRKAHMAIASSALRGVVVHELVRLRKDKPGLKGWDRVHELLDKTSINPSEIPSFNPSVNPSRKGSGNPSDKGDPNPSENPSGTPSPTTAPSSSSISNSPSEPRKRGTRIPEDWKPSEADIAWQRAQGISDLLARREHPKFVDYWRAKAKDATKLDWSATWRNWLRTALEREANSRPPQPPARPHGWEFGQ